MLPLFLLIVVCLILLGLTIKVSTWVTEITRGDSGDAILGTILAVIIGEVLTVEAGFLIVYVFKLQTVDFMAWPVGLMIPAEIIVYIVGYFMVGLFHAAGNAS